MAIERFAPTVIADVDVTKAEPGPPVPKYRLHVDSGKLYRFAPGDTKTGDDWKVVSPSGGTVGNWLEVRKPDKGANLGDASVTIVVGGKRRRIIPAATLSANRTLTLGTTNAADGDEITITRLDTTAFTVAIVNGGAGGGTLITLPVSVRSFATFYFDGTNWSLVEAGELPA